MTVPIRVMVVDDHLIVREGLRLIFETSDAVEFVGEAADGVTAVRLVGEVQPDVVLMDLRMPEMDGLEALARIRTTWPTVAVVILTTYNEDALMVEGLQAGAQGYLLKDTTRDRLLRTIEAAARGETLLEPNILQRIVARTAPPPPASTGWHDALTERERAVLGSVARGARNKEIAAQLGITERTVKAHLESIYGKLGVDSRAAAVVVAMEHDMLPPASTTDNTDTSV